MSAEGRRGASKRQAPGGALGPPQKRRRPQGPRMEDLVASEADEAAKAGEEEEEGDLFGPSLPRGALDQVEIRLEDEGEEWERLRKEREARAGPGAREEWMTALPEGTAKLLGGKAMQKSITQFSKREVSRLADAAWLRSPAEQAEEEQRQQRELERKQQLLALRAAAGDASALSPPARGGLDAAADAGQGRPRRRPAPSDPRAAQEPTAPKSLVQQHQERLLRERGTWHGTSSTAASANTSANTSTSASTSANTSVNTSTSASTGASTSTNTSSTSTCSSASTCSNGDDDCAAMPVAEAAQEDAAAPPAPAASAAPALLVSEAAAVRRVAAVVGPALPPAMLERNGSASSRERESASERERKGERIGECKGDRERERERERRKRKERSHSRERRHRKHKKRREKHLSEAERKEKERKREKKERKRRLKEEQSARQTRLQEAAARVEARQKWDRDRDLLNGGGIGKTTAATNRILAEHQASLGSRFSSGRK